MTTPSHLRASLSALCLLLALSGVGACSDDGGNDGADESMTAGEGPADESQTDDASTESTESTDPGTAAESTENDSTTRSTAPEGSGATEAPPAAGDQAVEIVDYVYDPEDVTVEVGGTVTWTNRDDFTHTATLDDQPDQDTGELEKDASGELTFDEAGTFAYHCDIHSYMKGSVEVVE